MTLVTDVLDKAASRCSLKAPAHWVTTTNAAAVEIRDVFLPEVIDELAQRVDWPAPVGKQVVIDGDGSDEYDLPADFYRIKKDVFAFFEASNTRRAGIPVHTDGDWAQLLAVGSGGGDRYYRITGYDGNHTVQIFPVLATGDAVTLSYVSTDWLIDSVGAQGSTFDDLQDEVLFPWRLLVAGVVATFRERKGLDFESQRQQFELQLARLANRNRSKISMVQAGYRSPFDIPVPDFIPSS